MNRLNKSDFLEKATKTLGEIVDMLEGLPSLQIGDLSEGKTAFLIVDMINGFAREGALMSPRVEALIPEITELSKACDKKGIVKLAFADCHTDKSPEFESYPVHCMMNTSEGEIVNEIKEVGGYTLVPKNSTNGFLEEAFQKWLDENKGIDTFIVTGDCTDICVQQFAITLKTWFNMQNLKTRVIVPMTAAETYDLGVHNADLMNVMALYNMMINGVEVVKTIEIKG